MTKQQVTAAEQKIEVLKTQITAAQARMGRLSTALGAITEAGHGRGKVAIMV